MEESLIQRVGEVVRHLIYSKVALDKKDLSKKLGYNASSFSQIINGRVPISDKFIKKLVQITPNLNENWLIKGEGEMITAPATVKVYGPAPKMATDGSLDVSVLPAEVVNDIKAEAISDAVVLPPIIPYNIARRPNLDVMQWLEEVDEDHLPHAVELVSRIKRTKGIFQIQNNAMAPTLNQGEYAFLKPFIEGQTFVDGDIHVIDTKHRGMMVYALYDRGDHILCRPENTAKYSELRIQKENVIRLYHILFHGSTQLTSLPDISGMLQTQLNEANERLKRQDQLIEKLLEKLTL